MALELAIVPFTTRTTAGTQQITSSDLTNWDDNGIVFFFVSGATSTDTITNGGRYALGMADHAGNEGCISGRINNANASQQNGRTEATRVDCLCLIDEGVASASDVVAGFSAALSNGIEINYTTVDPANAYQGVAVFIGGLSAAEVGFLGGAGAGNGSATDGLNEADIIFFGGEDAGFSTTPGDPTTTNGADISFGAVLNKLGFPQACCASEYAFDPTPSASAGIARTNRAAVGWPNSPTEGNLLITDIDATGFDWTVNSGTLDCLWAALIFPTINGLKNTFSLALETVSSGAGEKAFTGLGIRPRIVIGMANHLGSSDTVVTDSTAAGHTLFVTDGVTSRSISWSSQDNVGTTLTRSRAGTEPLAILGDAGTLDTQASFVRFDPTGFTLNFASSAGGRMFVLGIGDIPVPMVTPHRARRATGSRFMRRRQAPPVMGAAAVSMAPRFWEFVARNRRAAQTRLRRAFLPTVRFTGETIEEEAKGRVFTPGWTRARVTGPGVPSPDIEP